MMKFQKIVSLIIIMLGIVACSQTPRKGNPQVAVAKLEFQQQNYGTAVEILEPLAALGDADAQYSLGYMYFYGIGVPQNVIKGRELIQASAQKNNRMALKAIDIMAQHEQSVAGFPPREVAGVEEEIIIEEK